MLELESVTAELRLTESGSQPANHTASNGLGRHIMAVRPGRHGGHWWLRDDLHITARLSGTVTTTVLLAA